MSEEFTLVETRQAHAALVFDGDRAVPWGEVGEIERRRKAAGESQGRSS